MIPVIAVFGSDADETLFPAERVGTAISASGCIVLTGGTAPGERPVKNRALRGAAKSGMMPWMGIPQTAEPEPPEKGEHSILLYPGYNNERNYVEASLCHAAVAFDGGDGNAGDLNDHFGRGGNGCMTMV